MTDDFHLLRREQGRWGQWAGEKGQCSKAFRNLSRVDHCSLLPGFSDLGHLLILPLHPARFLQAHRPLACSPSAPGSPCWASLAAPPSMCRLQLLLTDVPSCSAYYDKPALPLSGIWATYNPQNHGPIPKVFSMISPSPTHLPSF